MATFNFRCKKCINKFSLDKEKIDDIKHIGNVFCPSCGDKWGTPESKIEYDMSHVASFTQGSKSKGKENLEASSWAENQARQDRMVLDREDPEVRPGVRKSLVDKINQRANDSLDI